METHTSMLKADTTANWNSSDRVLAKNEPGLERLSNGDIKIKIGDGITPWSELEYVFEGVDLENSLPTPSAAYRGKQILIADDVNGDKLYVCTYKGNNTYYWDDITATTILSSNKTEDEIVMKHNYEVRYGEVDDLELVLPSSLPDDYLSSVVFTSGNTLTNLIYPDTIMMFGSDCNSECVFTPVVNKRYTVILTYDGHNVTGDVKGVEEV